MAQNSAGRPPEGKVLPLAVVRDVESGTFEVVACTYCSEPADSRDHISPSLLTDSVRSFEDRSNLVPACRECNGLLGSRYFGEGVEGVRAKAFFLAQRYTKREKKFLLMPAWAEVELETLRGGLRARVRMAQKRKERAYRRIDHCFLVFDGYTGQKLAIAVELAEKQVDQAQGR